MLNNRIFGKNNEDHIAIKLETIKVLQKFAASIGSTFRRDVFDSIAPLITVTINCQYEVLRWRDKLIEKGLPNLDLHSYELIVSSQRILNEVYPLIFQVGGDFTECEL